MERKIIHIDMDAFYASIEERDDPSLQGKPIIVGGSPFKRGVVATANYTARKYGIRSALSSKKALDLCPNAIFIKPRFESYKQASEIIREIFNSYSDLVEPLSLDEAFIDVTEIAKTRSSTKEIALEMKNKIFEKTKLTSSAGVGPNKLIAKIASDFQKPNGLTVVSPKFLTEFLNPLTVRKIPGVGPVTELKLQQMNIRLIGDLTKLTKEELITQFGKTGLWLHDAARGIDNRPVQASRVRKSISVEDTFEKDLIESTEINANLAKISSTLSVRMSEKKLTGKTITLKITFSDFTKITRSQTLDKNINDSDIFFNICSNIIENGLIFSKPIRLLGIGVSNLNLSDNKQKIEPQNNSGQLNFNFFS